MTHYSRLVATFCMVLAAALCGGRVCAFHGGFLDASGNVPFSAEFIQDYEQADVAVETEGMAPFLGLLSKYHRPEELAELEMTLGVIYAQRTGHVDPAQAVEHLSQALTYQLPEATYVDALMWRGGAIEQQGKLDACQRDYLRGLLACSSYNLAEGWPELKSPLVPIAISIEPSEPDYAQNAERRLDYQHYRSRLSLQQHMLMQRYYFIEGLKRTILKSQSTDEELAKMLEALSPDRDQHTLILSLLKAENKRPWP